MENENENIKSENASKLTPEDKSNNNDIVNKSDPLKEDVTTSPRETMISSAVRFLLNPKVSQSPMKQKRDFLLSKGLTNQEIEEACARAGIAKESDVISASPPNNVVARLPPPSGYPVAVHGGPTWLQSFRDVLHLVVLLGGAAYGCYYLWRRYITRWLFGSGEKSSAELNLEASQNIQKSMVALLNSVEVLQTSLDAHCSAIQRLLSGQNNGGAVVDWQSQCDQIRDEIRSVKGIMLGTSRFPTNPTIKPISSSIPTWQLEDKSSTNSKVDIDKTSNNNDIDLHKVTNGGPEEVSTINGAASSNPDLVLQD